jgi:hypothetical protein
MNYTNILLGAGLVALGFYAGKKAKEKGIKAPLVDKLVDGDESNINGAQLRYYDTHSNAVGDGKFVAPRVKQSYYDPMGRPCASGYQKEGRFCVSKQVAKSSNFDSQYNYANGGDWDSVPVR